MVCCELSLPTSLFEGCFAPRLGWEGDHPMDEMRQREATPGLGHFLKSSIDSLDTAVVRSGAQTEKDASLQKRLEIWEKHQKHLDTDATSSISYLGEIMQGFHTTVKSSRILMVTMYRCVYYPMNFRSWMCEQWQGSLRWSPLAHLEERDIVAVNGYLQTCWAKCHIMMLYMGKPWTQDVKSLRIKIGNRRMHNNGELAGSQCKRIWSEDILNFVEIRKLLPAKVLVPPTSLVLSRLFA